MTFIIVICFLLFFLPFGNLHSGTHNVHRTMSCHKLASFFHLSSGTLLSDVTHFPVKHFSFPSPVQLHSPGVIFSTADDSKLRPCPLILLQTLRPRPALAFSPEKVRTHTRRSSSRLFCLSMGILMMCLLYFLLDTWFLSNVKLAARIATGNTTVQVFRGLSTTSPSPLFLPYRCLSRSLHRFLFLRPTLTL